MKIAIFGLGYVGTVTAACLAKQGHTVAGIDVNPAKTDSFGKGIPPVAEPGLDVLLESAARAGRLSAATDVRQALASADVILVSVGTPPKPNGDLNLEYVSNVCTELAGILRGDAKPRTLVFRSTMLPGSTRGLVERHLGGLADSLEVVFYPEFLREGCAIRDFEEPSLVVVGTRDGKAPGPRVRELVGSAVEVVDWETAELIKYACNSFHAAKVAFANEIGRVAKHLGINGRTVMELLCRDDKLNISSAYLRPGTPYGGSCLPKDVSALVSLARKNNVNLPVLEHLAPSNRDHLQALLALVEARKTREVVFLGLTFKADTDDLRESPMLEAAQHLLGHGYTLRIFDPYLNLGKLTGRNEEMVRARIPHLQEYLIGDLDAALGSSGVVVLSQKCAPQEKLQARLTPAHHVIDLVGWDGLRAAPSGYEGMCW